MRNNPKQLWHYQWRKSFRTRLPTTIQLTTTVLVSFSIFRSIPTQLSTMIQPTTTCHEELVIQNLRREPHSSVMVRRFHKRKSCCHVIAISQAGIAAPILTATKGFQAKKMLRSFPLSFLRTASILRIFPYHAFVTQARIEPGCDG